MSGVKQLKQLQPKVMSMRSSGYISHRMPVIEPPTVKVVPVDEAIEILQYTLETLSNTESRYLALLTKTQGQSTVPMKLMSDLQALSGSMNMQVSMKKKELAAIVGLTESSFSSRYFPKRMGQLWFCTEPDSSYKTPLDFLRTILFQLKNTGKVSLEFL